MESHRVFVTRFIVLFWPYTSFFGGTFYVGGGYDQINPASQVLLQAKIKALHFLTIYGYVLISGSRGKGHIHAM